MKTYDFSTIIDRTKSHSLKWEKYNGKDILPFWVADMDFAAPPEVIEAIQNRLQHNILGYTNSYAAMSEAFINYAKKMYGWKIQPEWIIWLPGLVCGLHLACRSIVGDVFVMPPVYPPFLSSPILSGKQRIDFPLIFDDVAYKNDKNKNAFRLDFASIEQHFQNAKANSLLLLCSPHNPVGRAWNADELQHLAKLAQKYNIVICSDEIHCDLLLDENLQHLPIEKLNTDLQLNLQTITLMAPSKTYNLPGLACALAIIPDANLRKKYKQVRQGIVPDANLFGYIGVETAFSQCLAWKEQLLAVLRKNHNELFALVNEELNAYGIAMQKVEATYLAWLDVRSLGEKISAADFEEFGLGLSDGSDFGNSGFVRFNFGCPNALLQQGLQRLKIAVKALWERNKK